ncbi:YMGG-like glycine zipper-containing protein [Cupriavidus sp. WGlv3]|uniref:YMGG-like glycine zipper-containing protein n=1 Tax=Cupriavidus sp. WGlv3 TaxID=2919924 RepID=UPI002091848B|nr:YMGG-like glycine zipper-containing protein [Cupriavidus sp. WGlv3]MCO4865322.1 YMGG-like glycine zipper-containing protein [Cupriavidus sp. WGlv3]
MKQRQHRKPYLALGALAAALALAPLPATAQNKPIAYPAKGQSQQQQASDDGACYSWAKQQTGVDPAQAANAPPPAQAQSGQRVRGAAGGAAAGAVAGAIAGDAGKGAAIGAATGTVAGGMAHRQSRRQANAANQQAAANTSQAMGSYYQAWGACMQGRGYSVQ